MCISKKNKTTDKDEKVLKNNNNAPGDDWFNNPEKRQKKQWPDEDLWHESCANRMDANSIKKAGV